MSSGYGASPHVSEAVPLPWHSIPFLAGHCRALPYPARAPCKAEFLVSMVQSGAKCTMTSTPAQNVRLTITVTPEVHATFQRLSKAGSMSISRAMGEWLGDTVEAAEFMAEKMEQARAAPKVVMAEMHAYALGLADETGAMLQRVREKGRQQRSAQVNDARAAAAVPLPPSSNTGGKGTRPGTGKPGLVRASRAAK